MTRGLATRHLGLDLGATNLKWAVAIGLALRPLLAIALKEANGA